jgi:hypothetical protein
VSNQSVSEYKVEGRDCLARWTTLLNKNDHSSTELKELQYIQDKFGELPMFKAAASDNYDRRQMHSGFGSPDCSCHITPPCQSCIDWTNYCDERADAVEIDKEPGCTVIAHGCDADGVA